MCKFCTYCRRQLTFLLIYNSVYAIHAKMRVEFLVLPNGKVPVEEFFGELADKALAKVYRLIEQLEEKGTLPFPHARKLEGYRGLMKTKSIRPLLQKKLERSAFVKAYAEESYLLRIGVAISETRERIGLSQGVLAKKLGTTQSVISRIEHGNQNLSLSMLAKIAYVLKCDLSVNLQPHRQAA